MVITEIRRTVDGELCTSHRREEKTKLGNTYEKKWRREAGNFSKGNPLSDKAIWQPKKPRKGGDRDEGGFRSRFVK